VLKPIQTQSQHRPAVYKTNVMQDIDFSLCLIYHLQKNN